MDAAETIRAYHENPGLDEGLRGAHTLLKAGELVAVKDEFS